MFSNAFVLPGAPAELVARINARRARIPAGMVMSATERPSGVSEEEWDALGDPGKRALSRERAAREQAERDLVSARSAERLGQKPKDADAEPVDINAIITQAVAAAIQPFQKAEEDRAAREAQGALAAKVRDAAKERLHDDSDALAHLDIDKLATDGQPDDAKIAAALDDLVKAKPYLAKPTDDRRRFDPHQPVGGTQPPADAAEKVKEALDRMKAATGIRFAENA